MPRLLRIHSYTLNMKVALVLLLLSIFLLSILFLLVIPKMQQEQYNLTKKRIEQMIAVTKEQVKVAGKAIEIQAILEKRETKYKLLLDLQNIQKQNKHTKDIKKLVLQSGILNHCSYYIKSNNNVKTDIKESLFLEELKNPIFNKWENHQSKDMKHFLNKKINYQSYSIKLNNNNSQLSIICKEYNLNKNHANFEEDIKINVQKTFALTRKFHRGKTYLMWINPKYINNDNEPLYEKDKIKRKQKYLISNMSNVKNVYTGDLTAKKIFDNKNKEPVLHTIDNKKALTWIKDLSDKDDKYIFLLITTVFLEDLNMHIDSTFWKILPASITALLLAIIAGFFIFKRLFKGINILANTAKEINKGNKNIRSKVRGNDDIGHLGIAFDSMLDSMQNNIKTLDSKVENKTKELKNSLNEKDILLKEIHHRVKNNLALTISLIKLQQAKIKDDKTKNILKDIQERIYTMELVHRKLYESTNLNHINFKEYVTNLVNDIEGTYNYKKDFFIKIKINSIFLDIEKAMPCGLILNELITNSFKYAFKNKKKPKLKITMKKIEDTYFLIVKDNGEGIPEKIDIYNSNTLGLKLINSILRLQLNGSITYKKENGSKFILKF